MPGLSDKVLATAKAMLPQMFAAGRAHNPMAALYISLVKKILIVPGDRYDRYIGWKDGVDGGVLRVSVGNFLDKDPKNAGIALVTEIARHVYSKLPDAELDDQNVEVYRVDGKKLLMKGSAYPDISNVPFFRMVKRAYEMLAPIDPKLRRYADLIDEIDYNPPSHHFKQFGTIDVTAAYYSRLIGKEGRHVIFVRRKVTYLSPLFVARTLIHEGTHADQQMRAAAYRRELPKLEAELAKLKAGSTKADDLKTKIEMEKNFTKAWYQGVDGPNGKIQDVRFECEALINEINAVREIDAPPSTMNDSGYLKLCPDAQMLMVAWKDGKLGKVKR